MTVAELIKKLKDIDPELEVHFVDNEYGPQPMLEVCVDTFDVHIDELYIGKTKTVYGVVFS